MHERPEFPWTLETLAEAAGMSRARFAVNFRDKAGMTPLEYLTDWRLSVARKLLQQGRSISSIASLVGYQSHTALTRMITKKLGVPPKEWADKLIS
jgi:AraC-like DNA-binding protein